MQDTSSFILELIKQRGLEPLSAFVRLSLDGGGGFMKVIVNVFSPDEDLDDGLYINSGVQRSQILSIVEDVPESNQNLRLILEKLNLQDLKYYVAFDLKCGNALFGLSAHSGKRACLWCEGLSTEESGTLRTLGSFDLWHQKYLENNSKKSSMQYYMNCINPRILYLNDDSNTLMEHLVPPPELHILIGVVSLLGTLILDIWSGFDDWLKSKCVLQRGYQGRGWDSNNSNRILKNLDSLEMELLKTEPHLVPFIQCLKDFRDVKDACFSKKLESGYKFCFARFKNSFKS